MKRSFGSVALAPPSALASEKCRSIYFYFYEQKINEKNTFMLYMYPFFSSTKKGGNNSSGSCINTHRATHQRLETRCI
jgi:hypothetical protein